MSYAALGYYSGLGYDLKIKTPVGNETVSLNLESIVKQVAADAAQAAWPPVKAQLEAEMPKLLTMAQDQVVNKLWPVMQPKLRTEADYALGKARTTAFIVGAGVLLAIAGSAYWVKKG